MMSDFFAHDIAPANFAEMPNTSRRLLSDDQLEILTAASKGKVYRDRGRTYLVDWSADDGFIERRLRDSDIAFLAGMGWITSHDGLLFPTQEARELLGVP